MQRDSILTRPPILSCVLLFVTALMLHASWNTPFYHLDDSSEMAEVARSRWSDAFVLRDSVICPVTLLSHKVDQVLFSTGGSINEDVRWATASRIHNGLLHAGSGLLLFFLLLNLGASRNTASVVTLLWAAHPTACESVCWIAERRNVLAALLALAALLSFSSRPRWWTLSLAWILYALALFAKPSVLGLLSVLCVIEWLRETTTSGSRRILRLVPFVLLAVPAAAYSAHAYASEIVDPPGGSAVTALLTDTEIFTRYIRHTFVPLDLSFYYAVEPIVSLADPRLWLFSGAIAVVVALLCWLPAVPQRRLAIFGVFWFFAALAQNTNVVSTPYPMQDRFIYIPMVGLLLAGVVALQGAAERLKLSAPFVRLFSAAYVCGVASLMTFQAQLYKSSETLELAAAQRQPGCAITHLAASRIYRDQAMAQLGSGAAADPAETLALMKASLRESDLAEQCPDIRHFSNIFDLHVFRAEILIAGNDLTGAREQLKGWLPPQQLPMLADKTFYARRELHAGYRPQELAHAWALLGEVALRESVAAQDRAERLRLQDEALFCAEQSLKVHIYDHQALLLKGRALISRWTLMEKSDGEMAEAARQGALVALRAIPAGSPNFEAAQRLLKVALDGQ